MTLKPSLSLPCLKGLRLKISRSLLAGLFVTGSLTMAQLALLLAGNQLPAAYAQSFSDDEIVSYARTIVEIEAERTAAYEAASDILAAADSDLSILDTPLRCTNNRMADMPDIDRAARVELRTVLVTFCNGASELAAANDLSAETFNAITAAHREDEELAAQIQAAISDL